MKRARSSSSKKSANAGPLTADDEEEQPGTQGSQHQFHRAVQLLGSLHGFPERSETIMPVMDSLVRTILSQNTTDKTSRVAFASLKKTFPTYKSVLSAAPGAVEESIRCGGLADVKAANIKAILRAVLAEHAAECKGGEPSLEFLRQWDTDRVKQFLLQHKGVGPKTVSCVLMFNLGRQDFPVDTHVLEIAKKQKWVGGAVGREECYEIMNRKVPGEIKYDLHVLLVEHGKRCRRCAKGGKLQLPEEGPCPLVGSWRDLTSHPPLSSKRVAVKTEGCEMVKSDPVEGRKRVRHWDMQGGDSTANECKGED